MKVLFYGINFKPELTGIGKYSGELFEHLTELGWRVDVITAIPYYPEWKPSHGYPNKYLSEEDRGQKVVRCPLYLPNNLTVIRRIFHLLSFAITSLPIFIARLLTNRYDFVICVEPTKSISLQVLLLCCIFRTKTWLHVQDFEIDALSALSDSPLDSIIRRFDSFLTQRYSGVSTISNGMRIHAAGTKGLPLDQIVLFPNWVDTDFLTPIGPKDFFTTSGFDIDDRIVLYSGNLGMKQGLERIPNLARHFLNRPEVKFVICGAGAMRKQLKEDCTELRNVHFLELQPYEDLPYMLRSAKVHLVLQNANFSDLVMPSKLTSLLSCGCNAVVTALEDSELGNLAIRHPGIFKRVDPENIEQLIEAVEELLHSDMNETARGYAMTHLNKAKLLNSFATHLENQIRT